VSTIRPLRLSDSAAIFAAVDCSRDALRRWMEWYHDAYGLVDAEDWIQHALAARTEGTDFHFAVCEPDDSHVVGVVGVEDVNADVGRAMIGYWLATPATGRGLATRAVADVLQWARNETDIRTVWATAAERNVASRRVLEANGFREVGSRGTDERGDTQLLYEIPLRGPER